MKSFIPIFLIFFFTPQIFSKKSKPDSYYPKDKEEAKSFTEAPVDISTLKVPTQCEEQISDDCDSPENGTKKYTYFSQVESCIEFIYNEKCDEGLKNMFDTMKECVDVCMKNYEPPYKTRYEVNPDDPDLIHVDHFDNPWLKEENMRSMFPFDDDDEYDD